VGVLSSMFADSSFGVLSSPFADSVSGGVECDVRWVQFHERSRVLMGSQQMGALCVPCSSERDSERDDDDNREGRTYTANVLDQQPQ
jgi:hypothetical protein